MLNINSYFTLNSLTYLLVGLVLSIAISVLAFSNRYLRGDRKRNIFFLTLLSLSISASLMIASNHFVIFALLWGLSNFLLTSLMCHKKEWIQAYNSAVLARNNFIFGFISLAISLSLFYSSSKTLLISEFLSQRIDDKNIVWGMGFLFLAAISQTALVPFHKWLLSSLNSPTPVSAIMHAGLINGGGILICKFAPLFSSLPIFLNLVLVLGFISAIFGTFCKFIQTDIKRMLACSTLGQMGFMFIQCGLGLFSAAVAHIVLHGFFKAYLFLSSPSAYLEKRYNTDKSPTFVMFGTSLLIGVVWALSFSKALGVDFLIADTRIFLHLIAIMLGAQIFLSCFKKLSIINLIAGIFLSLVLGFMHGGVIFLFEFNLSTELTAPREIGLINLFIFSSLALFWILSVFKETLATVKTSRPFKKLYISLLNSSEPHEATVSSYRKQYQF